MQGQTARAVSPALEMDGVGVRFGGLVALEDVSLRVAPGEVLGVMGPNGAGKTTLFNVVSGFVRPTSGHLSFHGSPLRPRPHRLTRLGVARTLQGLGLFAGLSVLDNVVAGARHSVRPGFLSALLGLPRTDREEDRLRGEALDLLHRLGVGDVASLPPTVLPYAVRKRVALARALVAKPTLLLLDEPAGGLGEEDIADLATLVRSLPEQTGQHTAVMLVEHNVELVMAVCDRIAVLNFGRLIATGTPTEVQEDPAVAEAYLGSPAEEPAEPHRTAEPSRTEGERG